MPQESPPTSQSLSPAAPQAINSRAWWEEYFQSKWEINQGSRQTRHFMERLLANLPGRETEYLGSGPVRVLDWGCAFGDGVDLLARTFPRAQVAGLDFAAIAIEEATRRHPGVEFIRSEGGEIPREFDVIVTSNCLEHFEQPLDVARS